MPTEKNRKKKKDSKENDSKFSMMEQDEYDAKVLNKLYKLGTGIPDEFNKPPWRLIAEIPKFFGIARKETVEKINKILDMNMKIQSGRIGEGDKLAMSVYFVLTGGLLRHYMSKVTEEGDEVPEPGTRLMFLSRKEREKLKTDGFQVPWLVINGRPMISIHNPEKNKYGELIHYLEEKELQYRKEVEGGKGVMKGNPLMTTVSNHGIDLNEYVTYPSVEKLLVHCVMDTLDRKFIRLYIRQMNEFMESEFGMKLEETEIENKWLKMCWKCLKSEDELKIRMQSCSVCQYGRYCSKNCQKSDWGHHKILHKFRDAVINRIKEDNNIEFNAHERVRQEFWNIYYESK